MDELGEELEKTRYKVTGNELFSFVKKGLFFL